MTHSITDPFLICTFFLEGAACHRPWNVQGEHLLCLIFHFPHALCLTSLLSSLLCPTNFLISYRSSDSLRLLSIIIPFQEVEWLSTSKCSFTEMMFPDWQMWSLACLIDTAALSSIKTVPSLWWFNWQFFNFMIVQNWYAFCRNCTLSFEFASFPGLEACSMILSGDTGQEQRDATPSQPWGWTTDPLTIILSRTSTPCVTYNAVFNKLHDIQHFIIKIYFFFLDDFA